MYEVILKQFENPDEIRTLEKGRFELVHLGGITIGRATYEPGWKWSEHVGKDLGKKSCDVSHVGIVVAGRATAAMDDGRIFEMNPGDILHRAGPRQLGHWRRAIHLHPHDGSCRLRRPQIETPHRK